MRTHEPSVYTHATDNTVPPKARPTADHTHKPLHALPDSPALHAGFLEVIQPAAEAAQLTSVGFIERGDVGDELGLIEKGGSHLDVGLLLVEDVRHRVKRGRG